VPDQPDPHGFNDMSIRELTDWIGAGNAAIGSQRYEQAQAVLDEKKTERTRQAIIIAAVIGGVVVIAVAALQAVS
jgi:hypothetical protein